MRAFVRDLRRTRLAASALAACVLFAASFASAPTATAADPPARKPGLALLFSVLVPGLGQLYNGDDRGYLYMGVEAGAWFARASYKDAGDKKEGEYEAYARQHWEYTLYHGSAGEDGCDWTTRADSLILWFELNDVQQFYEELGKLEAYRCGWDDFREAYDPTDPARVSPHRAEYRELREKSNDLLKKSELALSVAVLNRIVSGIDAFQTARGRRRSAEKALRLETGLGGSWDEPRAELRLVRSLP